MNGILANLPTEASIVEIVQLLNYIDDQLWRHHVQASNGTVSTNMEIALRSKENEHTASSARRILQLALDFIIEWEFADDDEDAEHIFDQPELPHQAL